MEPKVTRYITVSTSPHRATLGMTSMQLLGYHFVRAFRSNIRDWTVPH